MIDQKQYLRGPRWFVTKGRNTPFRPGDVPLNRTILCIAMNELELIHKHAGLVDLIRRYQNLREHLITL